MKKLCILLLVAFGFVGHAQVSYPGTYFCVSTPSVVPVFAPNTNMGGIFSASPVGLLINPATGEISPGGSNPGAYVVTYSVPASPPDNLAMSYSMTVIISPPTVPNFNIPTFCYGSNPPAMPSVSLEGISGTWIVTQTYIDNAILVTYSFTPDFGQCAVSVTMTRIVIQPVTAHITTENGSDTVYVDPIANAVVASLTLFGGTTSNEYSYEWQESGFVVSTAATYTVTTASVNGADRVFTVQLTNIATGCPSMSNEFVVHQSSGVAPPMGLASQTLPSGSTLGDLVVSGTNIQWYASANDKNFAAAALPLNTLLVDNTTYYASQTVNGMESAQKLPVTAHLVLGIGDNELASVSYFPNPVKNSLTIKALSTIDNISIINMLGQTLKTTKHNQSEVVEDMSELSAGTYFIRVTSGSKTEVIKVIKQ